MGMLTDNMEMEGERKDVVGAFGSVGVLVGDGKAAAGVFVASEVVHKRMPVAARVEGSSVRNVCKAGPGLRRRCLGLCPDRLRMKILVEPASGFTRQGN